MMRRTGTGAASLLAAFALMTGPALAHHVMDRQLPATFVEGLLSGLGHPIIGIDHFIAVVAIGCLAALHRNGSALAIGFVLAMIAGAAVHVRSATVPGGEILIALTLMILGAAMLLHRRISPAVAIALFAAVGLVHGYALGESIYGAESTPLAAYFTGLAVIQTAIALTAMAVVRALSRSWTADLLPLRLVGAGIAGFGFAALAQQLMPGA